MDKTAASLPSEKGIQMFRQKKIASLSVTSESAMSFRDRMLNRYKRVSAEQSKHQRLKVKQCRVRWSLCPIRSLVPRKDNENEFFWILEQVEFRMLRMIRTSRRTLGGIRTAEYVPLGKLGNVSKEYGLGQHFIHNQLNYRGLVLFPIPQEKYIFNSETKRYDLSKEVNLSASQMRGRFKFLF